MSKKTLYLLGILLTIIIGTWLYHKYCCHTCSSCCSGEENTALATTGDYAPFALQNGDFSYQCNDNFKFRKDDFKHLEPVSDSINTGILALKDAIAKNPNYKLLLTGYCTKDEKNTSAFPNLGFARANDVKNYLVAKGIPAANLDINGEVKDSWLMQGDTVLGPVRYELQQTTTSSVTTTTTTTTTTEDWSTLKEKINTSPLILYFNTNQTEINLTAEERQKVADIVKYLDKVSGAKVNCVGHTDNVGNRDKNIQLGQERADFAKAYFVKNGISADKINSSSKGPDEPIADNGTAEGRAKNRRTVVTVE